MWLVLYNVGSFLKDSVGSTESGRAFQALWPQKPEPAFSKSSSQFQRNITSSIEADMQRPERYKTLIQIDTSFTNKDQIYRFSVKW